jgi:uncharacterized protein with von Willebrand factor type A (vWA) domain
MGFKDQLARLFGRGGQTPPPLPRQSVEHDSVDRMVFKNLMDDSPRFRGAIEDAPIIPPAVQEPDPLDFTTATPEEVAKWQEDVKAAREAAKNAPPYDNFEELGADLLYSYHHAGAPKVLDPGEVDPGVAAHSKIMQKIVTTDDHHKSRNITRDDMTMASMATLATMRTLREALGEELLEQARKSEQFEQARDSAESLQEKLNDLRNQAREQHAQQGHADAELVEAIKQAVKDKRAAQAQAAQIAEQSPVPFDKAAHDAVMQAAAAGREAAEAAKNMPSFGQGFGQGEPQYESPEQALAIAEMWANDPTLKAAAELYGRMFADFHFKRAKRVVGGQDEIVDIKVGDELRRAIQSELALLADDDYEDDFFARYLGGELLVYSTVGEEHAGRGPIGLVLDGSYSMAQGSPTRNVWGRALAMTLLNTARREKRDFFLVEFSGGDQTAEWLFPTKKPLDANDIVEMASHFFGGGTAPLSGVTRGVTLMEGVDVFRKADLVMISDGEAGFGPEDKRLKEHLEQKGVRIHGIAIGEGQGYLKKMCTEPVVHIHDFELNDPNEATTQLATSIT